VKFLIPFSWLVGMGSDLAWSRGSTGTTAGAYFAMEEVSQPFTQQAMPALSRTAPSTAFPSLVHLLPAALAAVWLCGFVVVLFVWHARWRRISMAMREGARLREGREVKALRRLERTLGLQNQIEILVSCASLEPGIFGIVRPVLLWPEGISARLDNAQLEAILAHELWHARRRDNLAAAIHMTVEAIFWFFPLVWWIGARLVEERERACDEEVLEMGSERRVYAEGILKTCEFCVESPLACVSGISGSDLKERIVRIMTHRLAEKFTFGRKALLGAAAAAAIAIPLAVGMIGAPQVRWQKTSENDAAPLSFEVASIKLDKSRIPVGGAHLFGGTFNATITARGLIAMAYGRNYSPLSIDQLSGGPDWTKSEVFDIDAKVEDSLVEGEWKNFPFDRKWDQVRLMVQSLLADRFKLQVHHETKELPVYVLVLATNGPKLTEDNSHPELGGISARGPGKLDAASSPMSILASILSFQPEIGGRTVADKTGLQGNYTYTLHWTPENLAANGGQSAPGAPSPGSSGPSLFEALQDQLGLKLELTKAPVDTVVIDYIEQPSAN
jgi:uncharacterized protein (TIGR03435 family)